MPRRTVTATALGTVIRRDSDMLTRAGKGMPIDAGSNIFAFGTEILQQSNQNAAHSRTPRQPASSEP